jgi:hypothetical protein
VLHRRLERLRAALLGLSSLASAACTDASSLLSKGPGGGPSEAGAADASMSTFDGAPGVDGSPELAADASGPGDVVSVHAAERLLVPSGKSAVLRVDVERESGFVGALEVSLEGLPEGVTCQPRLIPDAASSVQLVVSADASLTPGTRIDARLTVRWADRSREQGLTLLVSGPYFSADPTFPIDPVPQGKIVVLDDGSFMVAELSPPVEAGAAPALKLHRFREDGALDPTFGSDGQGWVEPYQAGRVVDMVSTELGLYLATTTSACAGAEPCPVRVARHSPADGALDDSFGSAGSVAIDLPSANTARFARLISDEGVGIALMYSASLHDDDYWGLARWTFDGDLRADFGSQGFMRITPPPSTLARFTYLLTRLPDGAFLVAAHLIDIEDLGTGMEEDGFLLGRLDPGESEMTFQTRSTLRNVTQGSALSPWNTVVTSEQMAIDEEVGYFPVQTNAYSVAMLGMEVALCHNTPEAATYLDPIGLDGFPVYFDSADRTFIVGVLEGRYKLVRYLRDGCRDLSLDDDGVLDLDPALGAPQDFVRDGWGAQLARSDRAAGGLLRLWP